MGGYLKMGEYGPIFFQSKLERQIATATGQSETYAMRDLVKSTEWARHLLDELSYGQRENLSTTQLQSIIELLRLIFATGDRKDPDMWKFSPCLLATTARTCSPRLCMGQS